jgi:hypothetical protein
MSAGILRDVAGRRCKKVSRRATPVILMLGAFLCAATAEPPKRIHVYSENPWYWEYGGKPVLLLGGSVEDNLFQIPDLDAQLDLLQSVGGNYVRCSMSSRDEGNVWPFYPDDEKYDLDRWNEEYWRRFEHFLEATVARDIIVQIEVWETFDFYMQYWQRNPFNPRNNRTYTAEESGLPEVVDSHPTQTENNFFWSVPAERNLEVVLKYQTRFVNKLLSHSLRYRHILYCMDNETSVTPEWGKYWASHIRQRAREAGVEVATTEMWDPHDLQHPMHRGTFDHPELYTFVEVSQNNHQKGQRHWDNLQWARAYISHRPRPMNSVKIYGADTGRYGTDRDGMERFWRNVFGGVAAARFHRPASGLGLNEKAQANLRSMRSLMDRVPFYQCGPHLELLADRDANEAYCFARPGSVYAVYFPQGGEVSLDASAAHGEGKLEWLEILASRWMESEMVPGGGNIPLRCPGDGTWAAVVSFLPI